jgi:hypothetical protein
MATKLLGRIDHTPVYAAQEFQHVKASSNRELAAIRCYFLRRNGQFWPMLHKIKKFRQNSWRAPLVTSKKSTDCTPPTQHQPDISVHVTSRDLWTPMDSPLDSLDSRVHRGLRVSTPGVHDGTRECPQEFTMDSGVHTWSSP